MKRFLPWLLLGLLAVACAPDVAQDAATTTAADPTSSLASTTSTVAQPTTTAGQPTTTVEIVSPLPPPTGAVVATGVGWELTDEEFAALVDLAATSMQQSFSEPVGVAVLGPSGVTDLGPVLEYLSPSQWELLRALGLVAAGDSLERVNEIRHERVRGTCCPEVDGVITVQVEDAGSEPLTSYIIVHELVHALLTQSPPQGVLPDSIFDEPVDVVTASSEGVPQWVAIRYHSSLSASDQEAIAEELPIIREADLEAGMPAAAAELLTFGYNRGPGLVDGVAAAGVDRPYDEVLDLFPGSSEQVLFADAYLAGELPAEAPAPALPAGAAEVASGRLGSLYLMMLASSVVGEESARELVRPWAGDSYVLWNDGDRACIAVGVTMDDGDAAEALAEALQDWAGRSESAIVEAGEEEISLTSCSD